MEHHAREDDLNNSHDLNQVRLPTDYIKNRVNGVKGALCA